MRIITVFFQTKAPYNDSLMIFWVGIKVSIMEVCLDIQLELMTSQDSA